MDVDRLVWEAVRDRPDRKGLAVDLIPARLRAAGVQVTDEQVRAAVQRLVAQGRLYWRNPRAPRRLLHMPEPAVSAEPAQPGLFEDVMRGQ